MSKNKIFVTCSKRIPPFLQEELRLLKFPIISESIGAVETEGTIEQAMILNLYLRTGHRVLFFLKEFQASTPDELYSQVTKIRWENYIEQDGYISVVSSVDNPTIKDSRFANVKCKDAIVDRIMDKYKQRPYSGPRKNKAVIFLYWKHDQCSIYLDTSGEPLSKRGYRKIPFKAPMQESLAAAVIMATDWRCQGNFINPMCGSGTLAIEAALMALGKAPGLLRSNYAFMHLKGFNKDFWRVQRTKARLDSKKSINGRIIATDINPKAIEAAKKNAATAGVDHLIEFNICHFSDTITPVGGGVVMLNPEYGERLGKQEELEAVYSCIGDYFKQKCKGYMGYVFTGNPDLAKKVGLRTKRKIPFFNSKIDCRLLEYELYEGSKKGDK